MNKLLRLFLVLSIVGAIAGISLGARPAQADAGHVLTIGDVTFAEGSAGVVGVATVTVNVAPAPVTGERVLVDFGTSAQAAQGATATSTTAGNSSPTFPEDFAQTDGTITFNALETSKTLTVNVLGDNADEANEVFHVNLFNGRGECIVPGTCTTSASIGDARANVTITDDDATPALDIDNVEHDEGDTGTTNYVFTVTKSSASAKNVTVDYETADASASAGSDYVASAGTITFPASNTLLPETETVTIAVTRDTSFEPDETFTVDLSNPTNATVADAQGVGTITNDDAAPPPTMSAGDVTGSEGEPVNLTATLSAPPGPGQTAIVDWALVADEGAGAATSGVDFATATGTAVFTAGETEQTIPAATVEDVLHEANETFSLQLTKPTTHGTGGFTYALTDGAGVGTIQDDDAAPTLSISDVTVNPEGATDETKTATFTVTKDGSTDQEATVHYATADGSATQPSDYTQSQGDLTFAPGDTQKQITIDVKGDVLDEANETFSVVLSAPTQSTIADGSGTGSITDDDAAVSAFSIDDVTIAEGNSGTTDATFTVTKTGPSGQVATVSYATTQGTALASEDFTAGSGQVVFLPNETTKSVTVAVLGDVVDEPNEAFTVALSEPLNASIVQGEDVGTATITDDDAMPTLAVDNVSLTEGNTGSLAATFHVTKTGATVHDVSVKYATADWNAKKGVDYDEVSGTLTFAPSETSKVVAVPVRGDLLDEVNETYSFNLSVPTSATISDALAAGVIIDNDAAPAVSIGNDSVSESASSACTLLVKLSAKSGRDVSMSYATVSGTAGTADYVAKSGTVKFVAGDTAEQIKIFARADSKDEPTEKFTVKLSGITPSGSATFTNTTGTCSIVDND